LPAEDVLRSGRQRPRALASQLGLLLGGAATGAALRRVGAAFGMTPTGVNYAVRRGERLAAERMLVLEV
jgi:hypothetical protein